ncbi:MAG: phosphoribosylanthranilate isomerase [Acidimicrobiales bacterium]|nr:phosphoribosylanthranilate isomerase [Acidimicrobiales bacterium]
MFVKICGTTSEEDALLAVAMGADAVGFIFAPSPRQVQATRVRDIVTRMPREILTVGVFRDAAPEQVIDIYQQCRLTAVQLHGRETAEESRWIGERVEFLIRALPAGSPELARVDDYGADAVHIDSETPGSGQVFDWSLAEGAPSHRKVILAGGLTPDNVADAIARVQPWGVDVASGVESAPGRKDARKLKAFVNAARAAAPVGYEGTGIGPYDWQDDL